MFDSMNQSLNNQSNGQVTTGYLPSLDTSNNQILSSMVNQRTSIVDSQFQSMKNANNSQLQGKNRINNNFIDQAQSQLFDKMIQKMDQYFCYTPISVKTDIKEFGKRQVAFQRSKVQIKGYGLFVEVSFMKNKCFLTVVEASTNQYQILTLWKKQAQTLVMQRRSDLRKLSQIQQNIKKKAKGSQKFTIMETEDEGGSGLETTP